MIPCLRVPESRAPQLPSLRRKHQESARRQVPPSPSPDRLATRDVLILNFSRNVFHDKDRRDLFHFSLHTILSLLLR